MFNHIHFVRTTFFLILDGLFLRMQNVALFLLFQSNLHYSIAKYIHYLETAENSYLKNSSLSSDILGEVVFLNEAVENDKKIINVYDTGVQGGDCIIVKEKSKNGIIDAPMQLILMGAVADYLNYSCQLISLKVGKHSTRDAVHNELRPPYIVMSLTIPGALIPEGAKITSYFGQSLLSFAVGLPRRKLRLLTSLRPFDPFVWFLLLLSFLPTGIVSTIIFRMYSSGHRREAFVPRNQALYSSPIPFSLVSYYLLRSLVAQDDYPRRIVSTPALRCIIISWQLFAILMCTGYTSRLFGIIGNPTMSKIPTTWQKLVDYSYMLGTPALHQTRAILNGTTTVNSTSRIFVPTGGYEGLASESRMRFYSIMTDCMNNATIKRDFACLSADNRLLFYALKYYVTIEGTTLVKISTDSYFPVYRTWVYNFGSWKRKVNLTAAVTRFFENGLTQQWEHAYNKYAFWTGLKNANNRSNISPALQLTVARIKENQAEFKPLKYYDITGILIILAIGLILSSFAFVTEIHDVAAQFVMNYLMHLQQHLRTQAHHFMKWKYRVQ